jgi:curved DNA-binding protein CbpA
MNERPPPRANVSSTGTGAGASAAVVVPAGVAPTAEGMFAKTPLVHLFVYLLDQALTGTTVITAPNGATYAIYFNEGVPAKVRLASPFAPLDQVLVELGLLDAGTLKNTLAEATSRRVLHGRVLVEKGYLPEVALYGALGAQIERKLMHLYELPAETKYAFYHGWNLLENYGGPELLTCEPLSVILVGARRPAALPFIDSTLHRLSGRSFSLHAESTPERFRFAPEEKAVVERMRGKKHTLEEVTKSGAAPERIARCVVYALMITRHLDLGIQARPPVGIGVRGGGSSLTRPGFATDLGIPRTPTATTEGLRPAAHATPTPQRSDPAPTPMGTNHEKRRAEIEARLASVETQDHFQVLGVPREASGAEVKTAYFSLARTWHPDKLPRELADLKPRMATLFARINAAFETLSDDTRRAEYMTSLIAGPTSREREEAAVTRAMEAAIEAQKAEILMKTDLEGARSLARRAVEADPENLAHKTLLTWINAQLRGTPPALEEGKTSSFYDEFIRELDAVLRQDPDYERALFYRGTLLKRSGRADRALADFVRAAELNPRNLDAVREVRLHEMRTRGQHGDKGGLFGKFFKR